MEKQNQNENEIDLIDLFYYLKKKVLIIVAAFAVCAVVGLLFTVMFMDTEYTAETRIYVLNRTSDSNLAYSDFQITNQVLDDYVVLITGRNVTSEVIETLGLNMTNSQLKSLIEVTSPNDTHVLQISVTDTNAQRAADIANCIREVASVQIKEIMGVDAVNLVYAAETPQGKSGPSVTKNTLIAALVGLVAAIGVLVVIYLLDDTIRTEDDVERYLDLSVLGVIPISSEMGSLGKSAGTAAKTSQKLPDGKPSAQQK